jgi:hypothetical protein
MSMRLPRQSIVRAVVSILLLGAVGCLLNLPLSRQADRLSAAIHEREEELRTQEMLQPVYMELLAGANSKQSTSLRGPDNAESGRVTIRSIPEAIGRKAAASRLEVLAITPDPKSMAGMSEKLLVNCVLQGEFKDLRTFLLGLGELASFSRVEELRVREVLGGRELRVKAWFDLNSAAGSVLPREGTMGERRS